MIALDVKHALRYRRLAGMSSMLYVTQRLRALAVQLTRQISASARNRRPDCGPV